MLIRSVRLACALVVLAPITAARAASIWTPVNSGLSTSDTITGVAWPNANEAVLATGGGHIAHGPLSGLAAAVVTPANPSGFTDVSMSPDGTKGVAVGGSGQIYRSTDSGATWAPIASPPSEYSDTECHSSPDFTPPTSAPLSDNLFSVRFADNATVYITGAHADVLKSTDGGATFTEVNKKADGTCALTGLKGDITGQQWIDAIHGYLVSNDFGEYYTTLNGLASVTTQTEAVNLGRARIAIDRGSPTHAWAIADGAANGSYFQYTTDNGGSWNTPDYDRNQVSFQDIAASGMTVVAAGKGGDIYTTADGRKFYRQLAPAPLSTNDWYAVAMLQGTNRALVAGANGKLVQTTTANAIPGVLAPGVGASGGTTTTTGGTTIVIWKKITVSGHRGRYIPVKLSTKKPRRFVISLQTTSKRHKTLAKLTTTLRKGKKTVKLGVPRKVKAGNYRLVVQVFTTGKHGHQTGHSVKQVFVLV